MGSTARSARVVGALALAAAGLLSGGAAAGDGGTGASAPPVVSLSGPAVPPAGSAAGEGADEVADQRLVVDSGHVDAIAARMVNGRFRTLFKDSRTDDVTWHEPTSVVMHLTSKGRETVPDPADGLAFLGEAGDTYYTIPQTQDPDVLWAGWNTEEFQDTDVQGQFGLSLDKVEGPGGLLVFAWSPFGEPLMRFDSRDGLPDAYDVPARTHEHANWVFTHEGVYRMTFTFRARLASGEDVSDSQVFTMAVGDVDPAEVTLPGDPDPGGPGDPGEPGDPGDPGDPGGQGDPGGADGGTAAGGAQPGGSNSGATGGGSADGGTTSGGGTGGTTAGTTSGSGSGSASGSGSGPAAGGTGSGAAVGDEGEGTSGAGVVPATGGEPDGPLASGGAAAPSGALAATGSGVTVPLGASSVLLLGAGTATVVHLRRRAARAARL
ncbi:choice-of-anchor M domain-containing protein [Streptomyces liangshanensis]|uniref:Uncharacterized protein n=1 Tax=Streptomyces liangshanensis TaxID=2717324 RepID=A0A6G9GS60_9ACTN|nr:choice-of-anchor M domain-containing protein [Streptomyces liangshanensis]QIQ01082.1 hypothetical protein HA039_01125 [Streptomyces liangshanensis]